MRHGLLVALILGLTISCIDQKDYHIGAVTVNPSMAVPIAFGNLTIQDLLKSEDSLYIKVYPDDLVYLEYLDVLSSRNIRDLFDLPDKSVNQSFKLPQGTVPPHTQDLRSDSLTEVVNLGLNPEQLSFIDFKSGSINYSTTLAPNSGLLYEVMLSSADLKSKSTGNSLSITTNTSGSISLEDYTVTLNKNKFNLKMVLILKKTSSSTNIGPNNSVAVSFTMTGMDFHSVLGFLGDQTVHPPPEVIPIGAFGTSLSNADISFVQPHISLDIVNEYGVPCKVDFSKIEGRKNGKTVPLQLNPPNPITLAFPASLGSSAITPVTVVNAKEVLDFGPTELFYQVSARINAGLTSGNNFLADTSKMKVNLKVEVPLYGHATGIVLKDTAKLDLSRLDESEIESASLQVDAHNELPLDARIQLYLTDDHYVIIDSLLSTEQTAVVKGSSVTASGDLESAGLLNTVSILDPDKLNKLFIAKKIIIKAVLNSSRDGSGNAQDVKFKSKYTLVVSLGVLAKLKFNIESK